MQIREDQNSIRIRRLNLCGFQLIYRNNWNATKLIFSGDVSNVDFFLHQVWNYQVSRNKLRLKISWYRFSSFELMRERKKEKVRTGLSGRRSSCYQTMRKCVCQINSFKMFVCTVTNSDSMDLNHGKTNDWENNNISNNNNKCREKDRASWKNRRTCE